MQIVRSKLWTPEGGQGFDEEGHKHGAAVSVIMENMPPGKGPRLHSHPYGETWVVVEGRVDFSDGRDVVEAGAGDIVYVDAGEPHKFTVAGNGPARMVCIHQSDRFVTNWLE